MKPSRKTTAIAGLLLIFFLALSVSILHYVDTIRNRATLEEVLYISSPKTLKRLSLGYDGLLADIYWTRVVQYFGSKHFQGADRYDLLAPLLEITTVLDPHLTVAYEFGANFLAPKPPNGAGMPERAIELAKFGVANNPNDWKLYYNLGFIYYMELKDYGHAADAFTRGAQIPNAHPWMKLLAALMAQHAGDSQTARMMWTATYQSSNDNNVKANAIAHLRALQVDEDVSQLEAALTRYREIQRHSATSFLDLAQAGLIRGTPVDPLGHAYKLTSDGHVEVSSPDDLPFIQKGTPPGYTGPKKLKFLPAD